MDTADIYGPSELIVGRFVKNNPKAIPCTKFCCFRFLDEIDMNEVRTRIKKVNSRVRQQLPYLYQALSIAFVATDFILFLSLLARII